jgi:hypothetical protein
VAILPYFTFSDDELLAYLHRLDPLVLKYNLSAPEANDAQLEKKLSLLHDIQQLEEAFGPMSGREDDADKTHKMLELVYGKAEPIDQLVEIVHLVRDKLITGLLSVDGLLSLFNCKYFTYEWLLHTELDDKKQESKGQYYRDHFIHQVKDAYSMVRLLDELPSLSNRLLEDFMRSNMNVNIYLEKQATKMMHRLKDQREWLEVYLRLAEIHIREDKDDPVIGRKASDDALDEADLARLGSTIKLMCSNVSIDKTLDSLREKNATRYKEYIEYRRIQIKIERQMKKEILRNIMVNAMVMAGLFHDIGYPINYDLDRREQLADMIPTAHFFVESIDHFTQIKGMLSNTLLFRVVELSTIEAALKDQVHGALSAVAFLLYFYENGTIHSMNPLDSAAIEVAALSMFDHTLGYNVIGDKKSEYRYHHAVYTRDAMSFLLRFVDDIQEWGRMYFTIDQNRSLRICPKCRMPIVECKLAPLSESPNYFEKNPPDIWKRGTDKGRLHGLVNNIYLCGCKIGEQDFWEQKQDAAEKGGFPPDSAFALLPDVGYRKINHIKTCFRIRFHRIPKKNFLHRKYAFEPADLLFLPNYADDISNTPPKGPTTGINEFEKADLLLLHIEHDPFKALRMTLMDPAFLQYRSKELNKVRTLLNNQFHFASIALYANTTNNPIIHKTRILENFLNSYYARFAKAERLLSMLDGTFKEYKPEESVLLGFLNGSNRSSEIEGLVFRLLERYNCVRTQLKSRTPRRVLRGPRDVLKLRIFMLLSENPRWTIDDIEAIPRSLQASITIDPVETMREQVEALSLIKDESGATVEDISSAVADALQQGNVEIIIDAIERRIEPISEQLRDLFGERSEHEKKLRDKREILRDAQERARAFFDDANREYQALYERVAAARYEPSKIVLGNADNFAPLLRLGYAMRYHFGTKSRAQAYDPCADTQLCNDYQTLRAEILRQTQGVTDNMNLGDHLDFYAKLLIKAKLLNAKGTAAKNASGDITNNNLVRTFQANAPYGDTVRILLDDYFEQETKHPCLMRCLKGEQVYPEDYYETYKIKDPLVNTVDYYCRSENYASRNGNGDMLDVYSDLYMFYCLSHIWE